MNLYPFFILLLTVPLLPVLSVLFICKSMRLCRSMLIHCNCVYEGAHKH
eukprot:UN28114